MRLLLNEGFSPTDSVDVFDAGPMIRATLPELRTSKTQDIRAIEPTQQPPHGSEPPSGILFRRSLDFCAILTRSVPDASGCIKINATEINNLGRIKADELAYYAFS
jgi:arginine/ornithine N-succinyltransferase beta subunit